MYGILKLLNTLAREREKGEVERAHRRRRSFYVACTLDNLLLALVSKFVGFLLSLVLSARARCCLWKDDGGRARARFVSLGCYKVNLCCVVCLWEFLFCG